MKMNSMPLVRMLGLLALAAASTLLPAQENPKVAAPAEAFEPAATIALKAMRARAAELHISGVAVVAYSGGDSVDSWSSKMVVVGSMTHAPSATDKGSNLLGIAYAKAAEMAATLKDSGSGTRPPLTGEFGWKGGVVARGKTGLIIAAFSGGHDEDDLSVSKAGLEVLARSL